MVHRATLGEIDAAFALVEEYYEEAGVTIERNLKSDILRTEAVCGWRLQLLKPSGVWHCAS